MKPADRPSPLRAFVLALAIALGLSACEGDERPPSAVIEPSPPPLVPPAVVAEDGTLRGTWWAFFPELPFRGLRLSLGEPTPSTGVVAGSWIAFDWRASQSATRLGRASRPVALTARRAGDAFILRGPAPQIDARGQPTGERGEWELTVAPPDLPGQVPAFFGRARHDQLTGPEGTSVELSSQFRPHAP